MKIKIEMMLSSPVAYIRRTGAYGTGNIQTMEQLKRWAKSNDLMDDKAVILGIAHDDPQITPSACCRYDARILLMDKRFTDNSSVLHGEISGGRYAIFTMEHTAQSMEQAWTAMFPLLSKNAYIPDPTRPILERYAAEQVVQHLCEICVPIY